MHPRSTLVVFDLDGTLLDSDAPLTSAFIGLGIPREDVTYGHVIAQECARLGIELDAYVAAYDTDAALPFAGVAELLAGLERWAICSNKDPRSGRAELARLGWAPEAAFFADDFDGPKRLEPLLDALGCSAADCTYVGDTSHDRLIAEEVGCRFILAGWNPRSVPVVGDEVAAAPADVLRALRSQAPSSG